MKGRPHPHPRAAAPKDREPPRTEPVEVVFGLRAALAVFAARRADIVRVALAPAVAREAGPLLTWAASAGVPHAIARDAELERVAATKHHEGLCVVTRPRRWAPPSELCDALIRARGVGVALDRVRNPYNAGAILRSAAFFGVGSVLLGAQAPHPALAPDAIRVAEGGAEHVMLSRTTDLADTLGRLRSRGVRIVGADAGSSVDARGYAFARPTLLVLGHEREGMSPRVRAACDAVVGIRGSGAVESLNVAVATGVLFAEATRAPRRE